MRTTKTRWLFAALLGLLSSWTARADELFVSNGDTSTIGKYTTSGSTVNPSLISAPGGLNGIAIYRHSFRARASDLSDARRWLAGFAVPVCRYLVHETVGLTDLYRASSRC